MTILNKNNNFDPRSLYNLVSILIIRIIENTETSEEEEKEILEVMKSPIMTTYTREICNLWNILLDENQRKELDAFYFNSDGLGNILTKKVMDNIDLCVEAGKRINEQVRIYTKNKYKEEIM